MRQKPLSVSSFQLSYLNRRTISTHKLHQIPRNAENAQSPETRLHEPEQAAIVSSTSLRLICVNVSVQEQNTENRPGGA